MAINNSANPSKTDTSLIVYPCDFPIKVMGSSGTALQAAVVEIAQQHDSTFDANTIEVRTSSGGKYTGITITVQVTNRTQLDAIYCALTSHPLVKVVL